MIKLAPIHFKLNNFIGFIRNDNHQNDYSNRYGIQISFLFQYLKKLLIVFCGSLKNKIVNTNADLDICFSMALLTVYPLPIFCQFLLDALLRLTYLLKRNN